MKSGTNILRKPRDSLYNTVMDVFLQYTNRIKVWRTGPKGNATTIGSSRNMFSIVRIIPRLQNLLKMESRGHAGSGVKWLHNDSWSSRKSTFVWISMKIDGMLFTISTVLGLNKIMAKYFPTKKRILSFIDGLQHNVIVGNCSKRRKGKRSNRGLVLLRLWNELRSWKRSMLLERKNGIQKNREQHRGDIWCDVDEKEMTLL